jgi:regulator of nucleoside diphosphate kinase
MTLTQENQTTNPIVVTTGMYDLLKEQLRTRKLSKYNEEKLNLELRSARQVLNREIPETIVTVNKKVRVKDLNSGEELIFKLVPPAKAKRKHKTDSILSPIGIAILGYEQGTEVKWEMNGEIKEYKIEEVTHL